MGKKKTFLAGNVYVDSGMIYIGDPGSIIVDNDLPDAPDWDDFCEAAFDEKHNATDGDAPEGKAKEPLGKGKGIVMASGYGDGIYPVYLTLADDGTVESAYIIFK